MQVISVKLIRNKQTGQSEMLLMVYCMRHLLPDIHLSKVQKSFLTRALDAQKAMVLLGLGMKVRGQMP